MAHDIISDNSFVEYLQPEIAEQDFLQKVLLVNCCTGKTCVSILLYDAFLPLMLFRDNVAQEVMLLIVCCPFPRVLCTVASKGLCFKIYRCMHV